MVPKDIVKCLHTALKMPILMGENKIKQFRISMSVIKKVFDTEYSLPKYSVCTHTLHSDKARPVHGTTYHNEKTARYVHFIISYRNPVRNTMKVGR